MRSFLARYKASRATVALAVALVAALHGVGQDAYAAATNFLLNTTNTSSAQTALNGTAVAGKAALKLTNTATTAGSTALNLTVAGGHAPFTLSPGAGKVTNLNADKLDGLDATRLQEHCPTTTHLIVGNLCADDDERGADDFWTATQTCQDAGLRLPTPAELGLVYDSLGAPQLDHWTDYYAYDSNSTSSGYVYFALNENSSRYYCVTDPSQ